ncbi:ATP-binding protein [Streptomyces aureoverticillatus]|uniref:ATP-binding protein n=1 Tax=Streptomyces aureoverticillatus TaxID=66871 RepID=UPI001EF7DC85|nr:ATP-binding protein [Streptomyces aureoverticillatus]
MSHLRAPAARADRREGGRHGRSGSRAAPPLPEARIRPQLLRIAVLPAVAVGLCGSAAVLFLIREAGARPRLPLLAVLAAAAALGLVCVVIAAVAADRAARSLRERVGALRRATARGQADLRELVEQLRRGDVPAAPGRQAVRPPAAGDEFGLLAEELSRAHDGAVTAVVQASQLSSQAGSEQKVEVFVNLARRLQSLVHREISLLDDLENTVEDPELLKGLFHIDHLATRIRRHAENLAVLGGAMSRRQWSRPVTMTEVLRSSIAEVEQYSRVKLVPPIDGTLRGHAVADVIHLLAELVENATVFSAPHTQVLLRANLVTAGLAIEVEDRGLGMPLPEQSRMNQLLADPDQVNVASLLQDGRIGLFVVSALARRHGIAVRLQTNIYGGVQAVLIVPQGLLGAEQDDAMSGARGGGKGGGGGASGMVPGPRRATSGAATASRRGMGPQGGAGASLPGTGASGSPSGAGTSTSYPAVGTPGSQPRAGTSASYPATGAQAATAPYPPQPHAPRNGVQAPEASTDPADPTVRLPVRGPRGDRPTPAEALPGIRPEDRQSTAEHTATPPVPRNGAVRGRVGRPQLPRRRAQEHLAPQLRDARAPRADDEHVGHDPGLMAAFQRGIGLAQAAEARDAPHDHEAGASHGPGDGAGRAEQGG